MASGNGIPGRTLKRMEIDYADTSIRFAINPEEYSQTEPNRATITQTKGGGWIDAWGAGVTEITIQGTTGVKLGTTDVDTGYNKWKELQGLFRDLYDAVEDGEEVEDLIKFYNYTDEEFWYCYPTNQGIELHRSKSKPHVYQYTIHLWAIKRIGTAEQSEGTIGNPNKSTSTSTETVTSKNSTVTVESGSAYVSKSRNYASGADVTTVTNTKTKTIGEIQEDCKNYISILEPLIGGKSGKISPSTGYKCTQGITMQSSGTISNVVSFTGKDIVEDIIGDVLLSEVSYMSRVSVETYNMYLLIKQYSPEVLSPAYSLVIGVTPLQRVMQAVFNSTAYDSTIYSLIVKYQPSSILTRTEVNHIKIILLESMMVYREVYSLYNQTESLSTTVTLLSMNRLIKNIQAMILSLTQEENEEFKYQKMDVASELRNLEKVMTQIKTDIIEYM